MSRPRKYPPELLDRGARLVFESGRPIAHVARDLGVPSETLRKYVRQLEADQGLRAGSADRGRAGGDHAPASRELRVASSERDPQGRQRVFRDRARSRPDEVSAFIDEHRARFGVEPICRTLGVSASAYYQRANGARSARAVQDERLRGLIEQIAERNYGAYGYRKDMAGAQARRRRGRPRSGQTADAPGGIQGAKRRGKPWRTTTADPAAHRPPDLVDRDFSASRPDELWVADFTYLRCWEGVVFFSFVLDAFSRRLVGWQFSTSMRTNLVLDALRMALTRRDHGADLELVHHSDAGSQYTSYAFQQALDDHHVLQSIGSVGDAYDNALAESFVDTFKTELIADRVWRTRSQLELAIVEWRASIRSTGPGEHTLSIKRGNQQTRSPRNPARLTRRRRRPVWRRAPRAL
jgi:putative transposase